MDNKLLGVLLLCGMLLAAFSTVEGVVGGHTTLPAGAPYVVSVQYPTHICGGALVASEWVLTTASCVDGKVAASLRILAGSHRLLTNMERISVSTVTKHPGYDTTSGMNNVALLKLAKSAESARVQVIPLNDAAVLTGTPTEFYGWGALLYGSFARSNELQTLYQKTLSAADCASKYQPAGLPTGFICAQIQRGQAACSKDQGGPLVGHASQTLIGIYDHGVQCSGEYPDVFIDVSKFKSWIDTTVGR